MSEPLRVGVVGAGANTRRQHLPKLQAIDGVEVVAVANRSRESASRVAEEFGIPVVYDHWQALVGEAEVDAVVIGTWPNMHEPVTVAALEAGRHVLCEARMARDLTEARRMLATARMCPKQTAQLVPAPFTLPYDDAISRLIGEGAIGELVGVDVTMRTGYAERQSPRSWRQDVGLSGLNTMTLGIWYEQVVRWVGEATRVSALARTLVPLRPDGAGGRVAVDVPDHVDLIAALAGGGQLRMTISQVSQSSANGVQILGTDGTLTFADGELTIQRRDAEPETVPPDAAAGWRVEEEFVAAIRGTEPVRRTTFEDGVRYMRFTEAVHRSACEHRQVSLSEL
ncbi:Gfo/Idh/MocA family protein [Ruania halotolerans]|uniref:Gfo/Idh/MocA family protein n=1 Tax=Ruania halotolerans TaxID=2897773 RepID=UPI001E4E2244|nr:Gfo/Idh/MocA family oxidoreductase [Ruania halotolerans]UFU06890.1 Gfo/Idh/MocA family oxidoreductase [Ruania halotolerans]